MSYGLTSTGFRAKTFENIFEDLKTRLEAQFGEIDTDPDSTLMQLTTTFAYELASTWEALKYVNDSMYPDSAFGLSLDYICSYIGIKRLQATKTTTLAKLTGKNQIVIPKNSRVTAENVNSAFVLKEDVELSNESCYEVVLSVKDIVQDVFTFYVYVNDEYFSYEKQAGDTVQKIIEELIFFINQSAQEIEAFNSNQQLTIRSKNLDLKMKIYVSENITINNISQIGNFECEDFGRISLAINALKNIQTPVSGWISVINELSPTLGRDLETDEELKERRNSSLNIIGAGTLEAIKARILNVSGVTSASIIENATSQEVNGMPPHSFEALVTDGDDYEIAKTIWEAKGAGIETYGDVEIEIKDSDGGSQFVYFSRPELVYIYVDVTLAKSADFPPDGDTTIKNNIVSQISKLTVGQDVLYQALFSAIYSVRGVTSAIVEIGGNTVESKPTLSSANVTIETGQVQKTDISKINII